MLRLSQVLQLRLGRVLGVALTYPDRVGVAVGLVHDELGYEISFPARAGGRLLTFTVTLSEPVVLMVAK